MFVNFTEEARKILMLSKKEMYELKHSYIGTEHVLLAIMHTKNNISKKLQELGLTYADLKQEIVETIGYGSSEQELFVYTPLLKRVIESSILNAKENNSEVTIEEIFTSILEEGDGMAYRILLEMNINLDKFIIPSHKNRIKKNKKLVLDELGLDLTKKALNNELDPVIGRENELKRVIEILSRRTKNNPILIGKAGVGKTAIVEELARRIAAGEVPNYLKNKRIISLDMASSVAGTKYRGEFEERIRKIIKEVEDNNDIILFIDEIHTLVGAGGAEGAIDASNIFKPSLARNKFRVIGATTVEEYKKFIEKDHALDRRFQKVLIEVPNRENTINILKQLKEIYGGYHQVIINDEVITKIVDLTDKYIFDRNQPDKAIDVLDEVCAMVNIRETKEFKEYTNLTKELSNVIKAKKKAIFDKNYQLASNLKEKENIILDELNKLEIATIKKNKLKEVTLNDVASVISAKTNTPVYEIMADSVKIINNIESQLKDKIIGQNEALNEVIKLSKRLKLGYKDDSKCYSMLFLGPTGVGKTLLALSFGKLISSNIIRLDMSEYSEAHAVSKIIGAPPGYVGYEDSHNVFEEVREKNSGVIILDEIEKAHPAVINLFLQILDQSSIKDSLGRIIHFDNYVLIMTSNIGYENNKVGFNQEHTTSELKEYFSLSFINRIDNIIYFNALNENDIEKIIKKKLEKLKEKYEQKGIKVKYSSKLKKDIIKNINYKEYGARKIDKYIKDKIETRLIDEIIENKGEIYELSTT